MNKEVLKKMREVEDILLEDMKRKEVEIPRGQTAVLRPVQLEKAKVFVDLMRIEVNLKEEPEEPEPAAAPEEPSTLEDKEIICQKVAEMLRFTRAGEKIKTIEYRVDPFMETEYAVIIWGHGEKQTVNITADSGVAIIKDICKAIS